MIQKHKQITRPEKPNQQVLFNKRDIKGDKNKLICCRNLNKKFLQGDKLGFIVTYKGFKTALNLENAIDEPKP